MSDDQDLKFLWIYNNLEICESNTYRLSVLVIAQVTNKLIVYRFVSSGFEVSLQF